jgi:hypothetical protein
MHESPTALPAKLELLATLTADSVGCTLARVLLHVMQRRVHMKDDKAVCKKFRTISDLRRTRCNICGGQFRALTRFHRFCPSCKQSDELYRFFGWFRGGATA